MRDIVIIGSANIDLLLRTERLPREGETITGGEFCRALGGKGANQAVAAARAGGQVHLIGCVGADEYGEEIARAMADEGIDITHLHRVQDAATGTAIIIADRAGRSIVAVAPGANHRLRPEHIDRADELLRRSRLIVIQGELHTETLAYVLRRADALGRPVLLNLSPAQPLASDLLDNLQWLVVNEKGAEALTAIPVNGIPMARAAANQLGRLVPGGIIITLGARGALVTHRGQQYLVPAFAVEAKDPTAAGDAFCGAFAVGIVEGMLVDESVHFASAAAAVAVTRSGTQASIPRREEIDGFLREQQEG